jgi:hypothetical protein
MSARMCSFLETLGKNPFPGLVYVLEVTIFLVYDSISLSAKLEISESSWVKSFLYSHQSYPVTIARKGASFLMTPMI